MIYFDLYELSELKPNNRIYVYDSDYECFESIDTSLIKTLNLSKEDLADCFISTANFSKNLNQFISNMFGHTVDLECTGFDNRNNYINCEYDARIGDNFIRLDCKKII